METTSVAKYIAELIGTMVLTLVGCGVAVVVGCDTPAGVVGTALAFGLSVVAMAYCIGRVSGCHINPAITIGMYIDKRIDAKDAVGYIVFQFIGAIIEPPCSGPYSRRSATGAPSPASDRMDTAKPPLATSRSQERCSSRSS